MKTRGFEVIKDEMRVHPEVEIQLPVRGDSRSAGYDLRTPVEIVLQPNERKLVFTDVKAYMQKDEDIAHEVIKLDDKADSLYIDTKELYIEKLAAKTGNAETLVDLLLVGKYLERICDHAVNIAKWVL